MSKEYCEDCGREVDECVCFGLGEDFDPLDEGILYDPDWDDFEKDLEDVDESTALG